MRPLAVRQWGSPHWPLSASVAHEAAGSPARTFPPAPSSGSRSSGGPQSPAGGSDASYVLGEHNQPHTVPRWCTILVQDVVPPRCGVMTFHRGCAVSFTAQGKLIPRCRPYSGAGRAGPIRYQHGSFPDHEGQRTRGDQHAGIGQAAQGTHNADIHQRGLWRPQAAPSA